MAARCLLYYITDRTRFSGDEAARRRKLLEKIAEAAHAGVDFIQLREKDLSSRELERLAVEAMKVVGENVSRTESRELGRRTALLVNSRTDLALAVNADGVHLRSDDVSARNARKTWDLGQRQRAVIAVSCHSAEDVARAASEGADLTVFGPVFEKQGAPATRPAGVGGLHEACRSNIPVLALGGITLENARQCLDAGAAGIAGIRLFQEHDIAAVVRRMRG